MEFQELDETAYSMLKFLVSHQGLKQFDLAKLFYNQYQNNSDRAKKTLRYLSSEKYLTIYETLGEINMISVEHKGLTYEECLKRQKKKARKSTTVSAVITISTNVLNFIITHALTVYYSNGGK